MNEYLQVIDKINQVYEEFKMLVIEEVTELERLQNFKLTPQQELIMFYIIRNNPVIANDIASHLNVSKSAVSQVLTKLESEKMIKRQANIKNRRELLITLGERGRKYAELLYVIDEQLVKKYYSKVELKDLQHVLTTLTKLVESVKNEN